jgi:hypothetical protein
MQTETQDHYRQKEAENNRKHWLLVFGQGPVLGKYTREKAEGGIDKD